MAEAVEALETRAEATSTPGGEAKFWQTQIELSEKDHKDWIKNGESVVARYRNEKDHTTRGSAKRFAMLYSNTETLKSVIYARQAKPDVRRRFADQDPIGKKVAEILERSLIECADDYDSGEDADSAMDSAIEDYLLPGRGVVRVDYEATMTGEEGKEVIADQKLEERYVFWKDFRHEPAQKWRQVTWIAFREKMNRSALVENFGDVGREAPLNWSPDGMDKKNENDAFKRAEVWAVWDKETRTRIWIVKGFNKVLRKDPDPYRLRKFYPIAKPLLATTTNDRLIPEPEFFVYKDQADGLDEIETRIDKLTRALKRRGVYDATITELKQLANANDNQFIAVKNYAELAQKGGLEKAFQTEDISVLAGVLKELHIQRDQRVQTIYEVTGISDILRGASDPNETLGAQKIKAQFGGARLKKRQDKVQKWVRDTLRIKAEIIAEHFEAQKLEAITGLTLDKNPQPQPVQPGQPPLPPKPSEQEQIMGIMRSDKLRSYRVDIETDSTVFEDAEQEKQSRTELIKAVTEYLVASIPIGMQVPEMMPLLFEILEFGLRGAKAGRSLEDAVEQTKQRLLKKAAEAAQQPPPPDPKVEAEKAKAEGVKQKTAADIQKTQMTTQAKAQETQQQMAQSQQEHQMTMDEMQQAFQIKKGELAIAEEELQLRAQEIKLEREAMEAKHQLDMQAAKDKAALAKKNNASATE